MTLLVPVMNVQTGAPHLDTGTRGGRCRQIPSTIDQREVTLLMHR